MENTNKWVEPQLGECIAKSEEKYYYKKDSRWLGPSWASIIISFGLFIVFGLEWFLGFSSGPFAKSSLEILIQFIGSFLLAISTLMIFFSIKSKGFYYEVYFYSPNIYEIKGQTDRKILEKEIVKLKEGKLIIDEKTYVISQRFQSDPLKLQLFLNQNLQSEFNSVLSE
jgi:hypothetical protein